MALRLRCGGSLTGAKTADAQAAYESADSMHSTMLAGANFVLHSAGWLEGGLDVSDNAMARDELTSGSSWHAARPMHTLFSDPNISRLQGYTIDLYKEIEETSGHSLGQHITGEFYLASTPERYDYLKRERSKAWYMGLDQEFISPREMAEKHPLIDPKHYQAVLWDSQDGDVDPSGATYAFAKSVKAHGAQYFTHTPVTATTQLADGSCVVTTPKGVVNAEIIVNCAGLWARSSDRRGGD